MAEKNSDRKPFLKWAGNKFRVLPKIKAMMGNGAIKTFYDVFSGSGAVALNIGAEKHVVADVNPDIIELHKLVVGDICFIRDSMELFSAENNTEKKYYQLRDEFNSTDDKRRKVAIFLYLNRHAYNGLCRYNKSGGFNAPFGRYSKPYFPEPEMVVFRQTMQKTSFLCQDFRQTMVAVGRGDVLYCDPPYVPISKTASFTSYASGGFSAEDQADLVGLAEAARNRGASVFISNHDTEETRELYKSADKIDSFDVQRYISCHGDKRAKASELLVGYGKNI